MTSENAKIPRKFTYELLQKYTLNIQRKRFYYSAILHDVALIQVKYLNDMHTQQNLRKRKSS